MKAPKPQDNPKKKADIKPTSMSTNSGIYKANAEDKDRVIRYYENPDYLIKNKIGRTGYWNEFQKYLQDYTLPNGEKFIQNEQVNKGASNEFSDKAMADYRASLIKKYGEGHPNVDRLTITPEDVKQVQTYYAQGDPNFKIDSRIGGETSQLRYPTLTKADVKVAEGTYAPVLYGRKQYLAPADKYNSGNFTNDLIPYNPSLDTKIDPNALKVLGTYTTQSNSQIQQKAKGGLVQKLAGGGGVKGDTNGDGVIDASEKQALKDKRTQNINSTSNIIGGLGTAYYASQTNEDSGDSVYNQGMQAVGQIGPIGKVIQGGAALGDTVGKPVRNNAEQIDPNTGRYKDVNQATIMGRGGATLNPFKQLTTVLSDKDASAETKAKVAASNLLTGGLGSGIFMGSYYKDKDKAMANRANKNLAMLNAANRMDKMNQLVSARNAQEENPTINKMYNPNDLTYDKNQNIILANGEQFDPNRYAKGGLIKKMKMDAEMKKNHAQMCSDGGEIKGPGGPKEDKVEGKVRAGSFIVPAENEEVAKGIRKLYLKAPIKKANLKQEEGEEVKLSNGEHLFTPEENEYLESIGIDLEDLAPNAEHGEEEMAKGGLTAKKARMILSDKKVHGKPLTEQQRKFFGAIASGASIKMACGGEVKGYAEGGEIVDPTKELAKIEAERKAVEKQKGKVEADRIANEKKLALQNIIEKRLLDRQSNIKNWEKKYNDSKAKLDALNKSYEDMTKGFDAMGNATKKDRLLGVSGTKDAEYQRKSKEDLLKKIQEADKEFKTAKQTYDYVKNDNNYTPTGASKIEVAKKMNLKAPTVPKGVKKEDVVTKSEPVNKTTIPASINKQSSPKLKTEPFTVNANPDEEVIVPGGNLSPNERAIANADAEKATVQAASLNKSLPQNVVDNGTPVNRRRGIADVIANVDPTSFVGIGQAALGVNMLKDEKRPVDKAVIDPTYNAAVNRSIQDAKFGLTPEQKFMATQDIQNALNDAKTVGLNTSGGSGVQAFNTNRAAINDAWRNKLGLKQADLEARMNKQKYADAMAADRANILSANRRQAFNDAMATFQQKQQAGSELVGAGLQNIIGAYRFNKEMQNNRNVNDASNPYKNV